MTALGTVIGRDTFANRPAASIAGRLFHASDTNVLYRDNGSSWDTIATSATGLTDPTTTRGDLLARGASAVGRLAIGAAGKILGSDGTDPAWGNGPLTTRGDVISAGVAGAIQRLALGAAGTVLGSDGTDAAYFGGMQRITDTLLGADTANIDFTSIPATFKHLMIVVSGRSVAVTTADWINMIFNNDSAGNYDYFDETMGTASSPPGNTGDANAASFMRCVCVTGASSTAGDVGHGTIWIPNYAATTFNKSAHGEGYATFARSAGNVRAIRGGGNWRSTAAISRVTLTPAGGSWKSGSRATLYGLS